MRFGLVTSVQLGLSCMEAIYDVGGTLALALTLTDDQARGKSGRAYLDESCGRHGIPLLKTPNINNDDAVTAIEAAELDWLFIVGWSQIARAPVLSAPRLGVLGMHPTLLPVGRGRAAIPWAILKRLERTGVTLFKLDEGVDTGPILDQIEVPMRPDIDATELYGRVEHAHAALIRTAFPKLAAGTLTARAQDESRATAWPARRPEDGRIDMNGSAVDAECLVRAVTRPYPGAFVERDERRLIIWRAKIAEKVEDCGAGLWFSFRDGVLRGLEWDCA